MVENDRRAGRMRVRRDEHISFLTELREGAAKALDAQPDDPFRLEVFALIDRDLQNALRAQQQEREEGHPKPRKTRTLCARRASRFRSPVPPRSGQP
jgi:hypothetical protein